MRLWLKDMTSIFHLEQREVQKAHKCMQLAGFVHKILCSTRKQRAPMSHHFLIQVTHLRHLYFAGTIVPSAIRCTGPPQLQWSSSIKCLCDKKNIIFKSSMHHNQDLSFCCFYSNTVVAQFSLSKIKIWMMVLKVDISK